jgi:hypothetical protein
MPKVQVYDPPMCCATGVCGPSVDPVLPQFAADLDWLKRRGAEVERYNMGQEIAAFMANPIVAAKLEGGGNVLPLVIVDGRLASEAIYPTRRQLAEWSGLAPELDAEERA